jgi:hypothetical protein
MPKFRLKSKVEKLDEVAEAYRPAYVEREGAFYLDPEKLEAIEFDDKAELAGALEKERKGRKDAKAALDKYKDLDPEQARAALQRLQEHDEKELLNKGEFDRLMKKRQEEWSKKEEGYKQEIANRDGQLRQFTLTDKVRGAAINAGVLPDSLNDVLFLTRERFDLDEDGGIIVLDETGDRTYSTVDEFFNTSYKEQRPVYYAPHAGGGSSAKAAGTGGSDPGKNGPGKKEILRANFDKMTEAEKYTAMLSGAKVVDAVGGNYTGASARFPKKMGRAAFDQLSHEDKMSTAMAGTQIID